MAAKKLLSPLTLGPYTLRNRVLMAPLTRTRCAKSMLLTTDSVRLPVLSLLRRPRFLPTGMDTGELPVFTPKSSEMAGSVLQTLFTKRMVSFSSNSGTSVASHIRTCSPAACFRSQLRRFDQKGNSLTRDGLKPHPTPGALHSDEIPGVIEEFRRGAQLAMEAGFDRVEVHGANGYLPDQFLNSGSNNRTDEWRGPVENRARFLLAVTDAVINVWGADRVGVRLSPANRRGDIDDANRLETYTYAVRALNERKLAYIHLASPRVDGAEDAELVMDLGPERFRPLITGHTRLIVARGYRPDDAEALLNRGITDAVAFGRLFISNPDLPRRISWTRHSMRIIARPFMREALKDISTTPHSMRLSSFKQQVKCDTNTATES